MTQKDLTFEAYRAAINLLAEKLQTTGTRYSGVYGVARGGYFPAIELANRLGIPCVTTLAEGVLVEKRKMRNRSIGIPLKGISIPVFSGDFSGIYPVETSVSAARCVI